MLTLTFGVENLPVSYSYPKFEDMEELLQYETLSLSEVVYLEKGYENWLQGIQLVFEEETLMPYFGTVWGLNEGSILTEKMEIDPEEQITQIGVFMDDFDKNISGLKFIYSSGAYVEHKLWSFSNSMWVT